MENPRKPDYWLVLSTKTPNNEGRRNYTRVGAAWDIFDGGAITIKLSPGVVLDWRITEEYFITLFQNRSSQDWNPQERARHFKDEDLGIPISAIDEDENPF